MQISVTELTIACSTFAGSLSFADYTLIKPEGECSSLHKVIDLAKNIIKNNVRN